MKKKSDNFEHVSARFHGAGEHILNERLRTEEKIIDLILNEDTENISKFAGFDAGMKLTMCYQHLRYVKTKHPIIWKLFISY